MKKIYYGKAVYDHKEINAVLRVLRNDSLTLIDGKKVKELEKKVSQVFGKKYGLMVNSGSSANLLSTFAACNPMRKNKFKPGDHAIIQSLCWPTSLWPLVQTGLKVNFIDIDPKTFPPLFSTIAFASDLLIL